jgi:hypothetical protein
MAGSIHSFQAPIGMRWVLSMYPASISAAAASSMEQGRTGTHASASVTDRSADAQTSPSSA